MAIRMDGISLDAAAGIYRANTSMHRDANSQTGRDAYARRSSSQVDTVVFSPEALKKSEMLRQSLQEDAQDASSPGESQRDAQRQEEQDAALKVSLDALAPGSNASEAEIKKAYHYLMKNYHPDRYEGFPPEFRKLAEAKTAEIIDAYKASRSRGRGRS